MTDNDINWEPLNERPRPARWPLWTCIPAGVGLAIGVSLLMALVKAIA